MRDQAAPARNADHRSRIVSHPPMRVVERPRGIVLGVVPCAIATVAGMALAGWTGVATWLVLSQEGRTALRHTVQMQQDYEDRIAALRAELDRVTSRANVDQQLLERKVAELTRRQAEIASRQNEVADLINPAPAGPKAKPEPLSPSSLYRAFVPVEAPPRTAIDEALGKARRPDRATALEPPAQPKPGRRFEAALAETAEAIEAIETAQRLALGTLASRIEKRMKRYRGVIAGLGIETADAPGKPAQGGPFVALDVKNQPSFDLQFARVKAFGAELKRMEDFIRVVPLQQPVAGEYDTSSTYGPRIDPFLGRMAMHSGVDFRAPYGSPVTATARGKVVHAGWNGGYGLSVDIDHGNGVLTRYGHMSAVLVKEGQIVEIGTVLGKVGSTGRSTGPHLHYETRINGEAVDPNRFLRAGLRLAEGD